jgi:hypothetical protein
MGLFTTFPIIIFISKLESVLRRKDGDICILEL